MSPSRNLELRNHLPEGWGALYERVVADLEREDRAVVVKRVKEKFGRLRIGLDRTSPALCALADNAERASLRTCHRCGAEAALVRFPNSGFWTRCERHRDDAELVTEDPIVFTITVIPKDGTNGTGEASG